MSLRRIPAPILLGIAALGPLALGIAAHLEHEASQRVMVVETPPVIVPVAHAVEVPVEAPAEFRVEVEPLEPEPLEPEPVEAEPEPEVEPTQVYGEDFLFVTDVDRDYVVLALDAPAEWGKGRLRAIERQWGAIRRNVAERKLPGHLRGWAGRGVTLHGGDMDACTGTLGKPQILAQYDGELDLFLEDPPDDIWEAEKLPKSLYEPIWDEGRRLLVAPVTFPKECGSPTWAQPLGTAAPLVRTRGDSAVSDAGEAARDALLALPDMKSLAEQLETAFDGDDRYPPLRDQTQATAWLDPDGTVSIVSLEVSGEAFYMCGGWEEQWGVATIVDGEVERIETGSLAVAHAMMDLEHDGAPEILTVGATFRHEAALWSLTAEGLEARYTLAAVPHIGCPC